MYITILYYALMPMGDYRSNGGGGLARYAQSADPVNPWIVLRKPRIGRFAQRSTNWPRVCELVCVLYD